MSLLLLFGSPADVVNNANTTVTPLGGGEYTIEKTAGTDGAYDASAVSTTSFSGDFLLRARLLTEGANSNLTMVGMNSDPLADNNYASIDYAWAWAHGSDTWWIYQGGTMILQFLAPATYVWIWRQGTSLKMGRGATLADAAASPDQSLTSSATLYFDSSLWSTGDKFEIYLSDTLPAAYSISVDAPDSAGAIGSELVTNGDGSATPGAEWVQTSNYFGGTNDGTLTLNAGKLRITNGSSATTFTQAITTVAGRRYKLTLTKTPSTSAVFIGSSLDFAGGLYNILNSNTLGFSTSIDANFTATGSTTYVTISTNDGTAALTADFDDISIKEVAGYFISGTPVAFSRTYAGQLVPGSYTLTGTAASFSRTYVVPLTPGSYALTGTAAGLLKGYQLTAGAAVGSYAVNGVAANLSRQVSVTAVPGSYAVSGQAASLLKGNVLTGGAAVGSYAIGGTSAGLLHGWLLSAAVGSYALTGVAATLTQAGPVTYTIVADPGSYAMVGTSASLLRSWAIAASPGSYAIAGQDVLLVTARRLTADKGVYSLTGQSASFIIAEAEIFHVIPEPGTGGFTVIPDADTALTVAPLYFDPAYFDPAWYLTTASTLIIEPDVGTFAFTVLPDADPASTTSGGFDGVYFDPLYFNADGIEYVRLSAPAPALFTVET